MNDIYDKYYDKLFNWSKVKTNNISDAEDLTNSVFLSVFEYLNKNITVEKLDNLIWKIAYNLWCTKAKSYIKEKTNVEFDENYHTYENDEMIDKIIYRELVDNISNMGLTQKEEMSFKLYYIDDLSVKEISNKLSTTESNIKYYLYNARKKIKERYYE